MTLNYCLANSAGTCEVMSMTTIRVRSLSSKLANETAAGSLVVLHSQEKAINFTNSMDDEATDIHQMAC